MAQGELTEARQAHSVANAERAELQVARATPTLSLATPLACAHENRSTERVCMHASRDMWRIVCAGRQQQGSQEQSGDGPGVA